jgi:uncharacterized protein (DUF983 family)
MEMVRNSLLDRCPVLIRGKMFQDNSLLDRCPVPIRGRTFRDNSLLDRCPVPIRGRMFQQHGDSAIACGFRQGEFPRVETP